MSNKLEISQPILSASGKEEGGDFKTYRFTVTSEKVPNEYEAHPGCKKCPLLFVSHRKKPVECISSLESGKNDGIPGDTWSTITSITVFTSRIEPGYDRTASGNCGIVCDLSNPDSVSVTFP